MRRLHSQRFPNEQVKLENGYVDFLGKRFYSLTVAITANVTTTSAPGGSYGFTTHATGRNSLFYSDGAKWQAVAGGVPAQAAFVAALTGSNSGTANGSLEAEGTLSTMDTYTDAAVNAVIAKLENNIAEVATKHEALRASLVTSGLMASS